MDTLVCIFYAKNIPHFETELEIIQTLLDRQDHVTVLGCDAELMACDINPFHDLVHCARCWGRRIAGFSLLSSKLKVHPLLNLTPTNREETNQVRISFSNMEELKQYRIENFDVGYGVLSSLVSMIKDPYPDLQAHQELIRNCILSSVAVYRSIQNYLDMNHFDRAYIYNGRYAPLRAVLRACESRGVPFFTHERGHDVHHYALFDNTMPHDLAYVERLIGESWANASGNPEREAIASSFFEERAQGIVRSWYSFVKDQQMNLLPANWNPTKRNVVIFNSSDDEFMAIGDSWRNPVYNSQEEAIQKLVASISELPHDVDLYLRMHPNMKTLKTRATELLRSLKLPRFTVLVPEDPVSTYALIKNAEKVITFGSTVGIEATYWGKPSILAGISFYRNLGGTYNAASHEEILQWIGATLAPKNREAALMFGYHMSTFGIPFRYFEATNIFEGKFRGRRLETGKWPELAARIIDRFPRLKAACKKGSRAIARKRITGRLRAQPIRGL